MKRDALLWETFEDILSMEGYVLRQAVSLVEALLLLDQETFGLVLTELLTMSADAIGAALKATRSWYDGRVRRRWVS